MKITRFLLIMFIILFVTNSRLQSQKSMSYQITGLHERVMVIRDLFHIPHIYGENLHDAFFMLGYLHAQDRLFEMDILRRRAKGELAELFGSHFYEADLLSRQLGIRRTAEAVWQENSLETWIKETLVAYSNGVNAYVKEIGKEEITKKIPIPNYQFKPWTPVDAIAFVKYMGWDQSGTDDDLWFGMIVEKFGWQIANELWPLNRPFENPIVPSYTNNNITPTFGFNDFEMDILQDIPYDELMKKFQSQPLLTRYEGAFGSNNWVIDGTKSVTGKPILCNDPHLGFQLPSLWYAAHIVAPDFNVTGVTFPGVPYVVIGHNSNIAWGITNMQADAVDFFVETFDSNNPNRYLHCGEWKETKIVRETINIAGEKSREVEIAYTVHGPVMERAGVKIAMQWTGLEPTYELAGIAKFNRAKNLDEFKDALRYIGVPAINLVYADNDGNIAMAPHGNLPIRKKGLGRIPHDGASGEYDWSGYIPRDELPFALNPPEHYLLSANQRPAPAGYPHYLGWMWDPAYRARRINTLLQSKEKINLKDMQTFQYDHFSLPASIFVPILLDAYRQKPFGGDGVAKCVNILKGWDFQMSPESAAPIIWTQWFQLYREAVWQDDFTAWKVPNTGGSWGFTANNRREPVLEVLEYITRHVPDSPWFDDKSTPQVETRYHILAQSFVKATKQLMAQAEKFGGQEPAQWKWGENHKLSISSIKNIQELNRSGYTIPGGRFTVNPGGGINGTGGGASWRMIVDFSNLNNSVGIYPGGQTGDHRNPHYDDLIPMWVKGDYVKLHFYKRWQDFPEAAKEQKIWYNPR